MNYLKERSKLYKDNLVDLWGHFFHYPKKSKAINFIRTFVKEKKAKRKYLRRRFSFIFKKRRKFRWFKRLKLKLVLKHYLRNFYMVFSLNTIAKFMRIAKRQRGYFFPNFLNFLEQRIYMLAYRTQFITNMFIIRQVIRYGMFAVNGVIKYNYNFRVKPGDWFHFSSKDWRKLFRRDLIIRLKRKNVLYKAPKYLFMNYRLLYAIILRRPRKWDIIFPVPKFDWQLASDFFFI